MIVFIVTFILFFTEALLHYNYGKDKNSKFHIPENKILFQIIITVAFFSLLNSYILKYLAKHYHIHGDF
jgi:hypothetical protein